MKTEEGQITDWKTLEQVFSASRRILRAKGLTVQVIGWQNRKDPREFAKVDVRSVHALEMMMEMLNKPDCPMEQSRARSALSMYIKFKAEDLPIDPRLIGEGQ